MKKKRINRNLGGKYVWKSVASALFFSVFLFLFSCKEDADDHGSYNPDLPVIVEKISPETGGVALPVVITGKNFGTDKQRVKVYFGDKKAVIINVKDDALYALVPKLHAGSNVVKVVVDDTNSGELKDKGFDYIVTSSVTTVAGAGTSGNTYGNALEAQLKLPRFLSCDDKGNILFIDGDYDACRVKIYSQVTGEVALIFPATGSTTNLFGAVFSHDFNYCYMALYSTSYTRLGLEFFRGGNWAQGLILNGQGLFNSSNADKAVSIVLDDNNHMFIVGDRGNVIRKDMKTDEQTLFGELEGLPSDSDGHSVCARFNPIDKYIYYSVLERHVIYRFDSRKSVITPDDCEVYAGQVDAKGFVNGNRSSALFYKPNGLDFDSEGNMYVADYYNHAIRKISSDGMVSTFAGGNGSGHKDGTVEESKFNKPHDVSVSPEGFVYVADRGNYRIRCVAVQ